MENSNGPTTRSLKMEIIFANYSSRGHKLRFCVRPAGMQCKTPLVQCSTFTQARGNAAMRLLGVRKTSICDRARYICNEMRPI